MPDEIRSHDEKVVDEALDLLLRYFDSAQVFVSRQDGPITVGGAYGRGNYYARIGQVMEWVDNGHLPPDDDDEPEDTDIEDDE